MNVEDVLSDRSRRAAARRKPGCLLLSAVAAIWLTVTAMGATPAGNNAENPEPTDAVSPHSSATQQGPADLSLLREARKALFEESNPAKAGRLAAAVLEITGIEDLETRTEALFLEMEAAALQSDDAEMISAARQLCEMSGELGNDRRLDVAMSRLAGQKHTAGDLQQGATNSPATLVASLSPQSSETQSGQATPTPSESQHLPPCQTLRTAAKFFSKHARYVKPGEVSQILGHCAPDLLAQADFNWDHPLYAGSVQVSVSR